ncbi:hypothetical protein COK69_22150 [Bacillus cereus]|nr:hypothetical protein COK69_22150 [Bacillus cereus]
MGDTLKEKIEWMLNGGFLTDKNDEFAFGIDLKSNMFYSIDKNSVNRKNPKRWIENPHLPLEDIEMNMKLLVSSKRVIKKEIKKNEIIEDGAKCPICHLNHLLIYLDHDGIRTFMCSHCGHYSSDTIEVLSDLDVLDQ